MKRKEEKERTIFDEICEEADRKMGEIEERKERKLKWFKFHNKHIPYTQVVLELEDIVLDSVGSEVRWKTETPIPEDCIKEVNELADFYVSLYLDVALLLVKKTKAKFDDYIERPSYDDKRETLRNPITFSITLPYIGHVAKSLVTTNFFEYFVSFAIGCKIRRRKKSLEKKLRIKSAIRYANRRWISTLNHYVEFLRKTNIIKKKDV